MPVSCQYYPAITIHLGHIHIIQKFAHFLIDLNVLLNDFGKYIDINDYLFWKQERIIWIGFEKNSKNNKCIFGRKEFSKDVVNHILSFLRYNVYN